MAPVIYDLVKTAAYDGAIYQLNRWLTQRPDEPHLHCLLGLALLGKGQMGAAVKALDTTLTMSPNHAAALAGRAEVLRAQGKNAEATRLFIRAMSIVGFRPTWGFSLALTCLAAGDLTTARRWNKAVMRAEPNANLPWALDGHIKRQFGGWFAERSFKKALRPHPVLLGQPQLAQASYDASERERLRVAACVNGSVEPINKFVYIDLG